MNIQFSKEFGISIAGEDQNVVCSVAGGYSGRHIDKIYLLESGWYLIRLQRLEILMHEIKEDLIKPKVLGIRILGYENRPKSKISFMRLDF
jgi:hypothetical protein